LSVEPETCSWGERLGLPIDSVPANSDPALNQDIRLATAGVFGYWKWRQTTDQLLRHPDEVATPETIWKGWILEAMRGPRQTEVMQSLYTHLRAFWKPIWLVLEVGHQKEVLRSMILWPMQSA
jgi:hypothetical protein